MDGNNIMLDILFKKTYKILFWKFLKPFFSIASIFLPKKHNKIVFENFLGKDYGDNPMWIAKELRKSGKDLDIVWLTSNPEKKYPSGIRTVKYESIRSLFEYATSKVWVDNVRNPAKPKKRKGQFYLQTWHGPDSGKKAEGDAINQLSKPYITYAKKDASQTDAIISNSSIMDEVYRRAFWLNKGTDILRIGLPKYDILIMNRDNTDLKFSLKKKYGFTDETVIVLYAPTFRDDGSREGYLVDQLNTICDAFTELTGCNVKLIVRMHPNAVEQSKEIKYTEDIINGSYISSFEDLSIISDYLITDYSSTFYDFLLLNKPVFICTKDLESYEEKRGLLPEYYEFPFLYSKTVEGLLNDIKNFKKDKYELNVSNYLNTHPTYDDGHASEKAAQWIIDKIYRK